MCAVRVLCGRGSGWQPARDRPVADAMGVAQDALHCHEIPWRCSFPSNRGVRIRVRGPCHSGVVQLEACACAAACGNDSRGACLSVGGCVRHRVRRAGGQRGSCARGGMLRRSTPCTCAVLPCGRPVDSHATTTTEAVGKLSLGARHTAWRRLRRAVCEGVGGRGRWSRMRWRSARCGRRPRCSRISAGKV